MAFTVGRYGIKSIGSLGLLIGTFYVACLFFVFVVLGILSRLHGFKLWQLMRYIEVLETCLGKKAILDLQPIQPGDVPSTYADTAELQAATGFKPATTVETGVRRFVEWYREYYK